MVAAENVASVIRVSVWQESASAILSANRWTNAVRMGVEVRAVFATAGKNASMVNAKM